MRIGTCAIENYPNILHIRLSGAWQPESNHQIIQVVLDAKPKHIVIDMSQLMVTSEMLQPVAESSAARRTSVTQFAQYIQDHPDMVYILLDPNETGIFDSTIAFYEQAGVGERVMLATSLADALMKINAFELKYKFAASS